MASAGLTCLYCGALLPPETREQATEAAERIRSSRSLHEIGQRLSAATVLAHPVVIDVHSAEASILAAACSISLWEARHWQSGPRHRLLRQLPEAEAQALANDLRTQGLAAVALDAEATVRARTPASVIALKDDAVPLQATLAAADEERIRRTAPEEKLALVVSASIRREKALDPAQIKKADSARLEDVRILHLHFLDEDAPWEIDPRSTAFEGTGTLSSYMRLLDIERRLGALAEIDHGFRNIVPAFAPAADPDAGGDTLRSRKSDPRRPPKRPTFDNLAQFRAYSAWRGVLARDASGRS